MRSFPVHCFSTICLSTLSLRPFSVSFASITQCKYCELPLCIGSGRSIHANNRLANTIFKSKDSLINLFWYHACRTFEGTIKSAESDTALKQSASKLARALSISSKQVTPTIKMSIKLTLKNHSFKFLSITQFFNR